MNLHDIVRPIITKIHNDELCTLYQSAGVENVKGIIKNTYTDGVDVSANWQPIVEPLEHVDARDETKIAMKVYLYSLCGDTEKAVAGVTRLPEMRTGDILERENGTFWLITSVEEDWSADGWACVIATQQTEGVDG